MIVVWLFLTMPWVCLQFVIVVFPDHSWFLYFIAAVRSKAVVLLLLTCCLLLLPVCNCSMFCCTLLYVPSSFAIILMGKRELVALLGLSSACLMIVVWLFLAVSWVCLQFVIVVFPDRTHLLFYISDLYQEDEDVVINSKDNQTL